MKIMVFYVVMINANVIQGVSPTVILGISSTFSSTLSFLSPHKYIQYEIRIAILYNEGMQLHCRLTELNQSN